MGAGKWSDAAYAASTTTRNLAGISTFAYSDTIITSKPQSAWEIHPDLDPQNLKVRESRDSTDHPTSVPVCVWLDVTGSNVQQAEIIQAKLPTLLNTILRNGYLEHPQILIGAIDDAFCTSTSHVSLQVGQFESDNRIDDALRNVLLVGNGGGGGQESYELAMYVTAYKTACDAFEKRNKKGFAFFIGDEMAYPTVSAGQVQKLTGETLQADLPLKEVVDELKSKWEPIFILPKNAHHGRDPKMLEFWQGLFGIQNVIHLDDSNNISETIAATIGQWEGIADSVAVAKHLSDAGVADTVIADVVRSTASFASRS